MDPDQPKISDTKALDTALNDQEVMKQRSRSDNLATGKVGRGVNWAYVAALFLAMDSMRTSAIIDARFPRDPTFPEALPGLVGFALFVWVYLRLRKAGASSMRKNLYTTGLFGAWALGALSGQAQGYIGVGSQGFKDRFVSVPGYLVDKRYEDGVLYASESNFSLAMRWSGIPVEAANTTISRFILDPAAELVTLGSYERPRLSSWTGELIYRLHPESNYFGLSGTFRGWWQGFNNELN